MFFVHATNDSSENSVASTWPFRKSACRRKCTSTPQAATASACARPISPCAKWPDRAADWMKARGLLEKK